MQHDAIRGRVDALDRTNRLAGRIGAVHTGPPLADAFSNERFHACFRSIFRAGHPDPGAILDPALEGIRRADLDVHVLAQLGEPSVGASFFAATFVIDEPAGAEDERELFGDAAVDSALLNREADIWHAELLGVRQRRIFADQIDTLIIDRLLIVPTP